jgi:hypothetical protein
MKKNDKRTADKLDRSKKVYYTEMSNGTVEIEYLANVSYGLNGIKKISRNCYTDKSGAICEYALKENRAQSPESIKRSLKKIRRLINNNFYGEENELIITLTYGVHNILLKKGWITKREYLKALYVYEHYNSKKRTVGEICVKRGYATQEQFDSVKSEMRNEKVLYDNMRKFIGRFRSKYNREYGAIEYICVKQPQDEKNNYAWHIHLLVKFINVKKAPTIDNETVLQPLWGLGFTECKSARNINKIASYVSKYNDERFNKYPSGMNIYSSSRRLILPMPQVMEYQYALDKVKGKKRVYFCVSEILDKSTGACLNSYTVEQYQDVKRKPQKRVKRYNFIYA